MSWNHFSMNIGDRVFVAIEIITEGGFLEVLPSDLQLFLTLENESILDIDHGLQAKATSGDLVKTGAFRIDPSGRKEYRWRLSDKHLEDKGIVAPMRTHIAPVNENGIAEDYCRLHRMLRTRGLC